SRTLPKMMPKAKRGQRILTEMPFVFVLKSKYLNTRCDHCLLEPTDKVSKCGRCMYVSYCNGNCQMQAWEYHKMECGMLKKVFPRIVPDAARMLCRLILHLQGDGSSMRSYYTDQDYRKFSDLMSHADEIKEDPNRQEHFNSLLVVLETLFAESNISVPPASEVLDIYGRLITNGFNILDPEMNSVGTGIYLGVSVTDHSCKPNAVATFQGKELRIYLTEDMPVLDWSKIFISYIDLLNTPELRRQDLKDNYYFLCNCVKCKNPTEAREMNAALCPNSNCATGINIELNNCHRCGAGITPKMRNIFNEVTALTRISLDSMNQVDYLDVGKVCLDKQKGVLHPLNVWHVKTLDSAFEAAINMSKFEEAIEYGKLLLPGVLKYHGEYNPLVGLVQMKLGKMLLFCGKIRAAYKCLEDAKALLIVTHGREHTLLTTELGPLIVQVHYEYK
ncbi:hypothetical protein KR018_005133, partial [Drosophila ironensis]